MEPNDEWRPADVRPAPVLFALGSAWRYGERVAAHLRLTLSPHEARRFEDGEHKTRSLVNVRDRDAYVIASMNGEGGASVNDKLCALLFFCGSLKDASAARVNVVVPYLAYARKDRKSQSRDPVTTRYVASILEAVGVDRVVTMDVHNLAAYQNAFRCRTEHLEATGLWSAHFVPLLRGREAVIVAPDAGGIKRADALRRRLARDLGADVGAAFAEKHRASGQVSGDLFVGDVRGKAALIVDDLISSGTTIARTAQACRRLGAAAVYVAATHALFAANTAEVLGAASLDELVVTDSVVSDALGLVGARTRLRLLDTTSLVAEAIARIHSGGSVQELQDA